MTEFKKFVTKSSLKLQAGFKLKIKPAHFASLSHCLRYTGAGSYVVTAPFRIPANTEFEACPEEIRDMIDAGDILPVMETSQDEKTPSEGQPKKKVKKA